MAVILPVITASIKPGTIHPVVVQPDAVDEHLVEVAGLGAGRGDGHLPAPAGAASEGPVVAAAQPGLAGGGGGPGDEQLEIGDLLAAGPGPGAGCGAGRGCGGGVADGALPALGAGGGASGLLHRGAADRAESGPGGTGSHPLDDQPTIVNNPTGSPVRAVITPIFGHYPNEKSDLKHHVHADNSRSPGDGLGSIKSAKLR